MASRMIFKYKLHCTRQGIHMPPKKFADRVIEERNIIFAERTFSYLSMSVIIWPSPDMASFDVIFDECIIRF